LSISNGTYLHSRARKQTQFLCRAGFLFS